MSHSVKDKDDVESLIAATNETMLVQPFKNVGSDEEQPQSNLTKMVDKTLDSLKIHQKL